MPDEVGEAFAALAADSERGLLLTGRELRYQAERRRSHRTGLATTATAVLVAAALGTGWAVTSAGGQPSAPPTTGTGLGGLAAAPTVSTVPSYAPSSAAPSATAPSSAPPPPTPPSTRPPTTAPVITEEPMPAEIPYQVTLRQEDANATVTYFKPLGVPEFCPAAKFPSQRELGVSASIISRYRKPDNPPPKGTPDDAVYNTVGVYSGDGAKDYMAELRQGAQVCSDSRIRGLDTTFSLLRPLDVGDESVLIQRQYEEVDAEGKPLENGLYRSTFIAAVRINDAVTLIDCRGYENAASEPATARTLGLALAKRLKAWRG
ncbi:hypothetical protein M1L60_11505 [Actinoplanes sp. TRM 88003]|uniref:PknH-like extracellular domain-containing protein n=1 Tax=Paractinoplanes aksuensis TaxID=2939490 RepID=A0ABT1DK49_9ACTN|nr:hypothetical protein [Actinoplanes aksuensis]MCO8271219.1 hypothetical protein [Actinoplanes aksuensis]